jgi:hypothetical protein
MLARPGLALVSEQNQSYRQPNLKQLCTFEATLYFFEAALYY